MIAGGIGVVAFFALTLVGGFTISSAAFLAILVAAGAGIVLYVGFHGEAPAARTDIPTPGKIGGRNAGNVPGRDHAPSPTGGPSPGRAPSPSDTRIVAGAGAAASHVQSDGAPPQVYGGSAPTPATGGLSNPTTAAGEPALSRDDVSAGQDGGSHAKTGGSAAAGAGADAAAARGEAGAGTPTERTVAGAAPGSGPDTPSATGDPMGDAPQDSATGVAPENAQKPPAIDSPRASGKDDLQKIKGIGPKLEQMLNGMGFYHHDQIAGWSEAEVAWVDYNIEGFKGRVSRDRWVAQAQALVRGDDPALSGDNG